MSFVDLSEVEYEACNLLAREPSGDYARWAQEIFRRRYAKAKAEVDAAEIAFREACKGGTFTEEEAAAHEKTLRVADSRRSITRASISQLVRLAAGDIEFAKKKDKWASEDPTWHMSTLPNSPEEKRDQALKELTEQLESDMDDIDQDEIGFSRGGGRRGGQDRKRAIVAAFNERKAQIEEVYYAACI